MEEQRRLAAEEHARFEAEHAALETERITRAASAARRDEQLRHATAEKVAVEAERAALAQVRRRFRSRPHAL